MKELGRLVLARHEGEQVRIGDDVLVTVSEVRGDVAKLVVEAPRDVRVWREELYQEGAR